MKPQQLTATSGTFDPEAFSFHGLLKTLKMRQPIAPDALHMALTYIMEGKTSDGEIGAFLMGLGPENETVDHIVMAARALRDKAHRVSAPQGTVDCCGTGGDGLKTYNISTAVAIIGAAAGVPVAKHGNRAASSQSGAADILEALGIDLIDDDSRLESALKEIGFAFLMAPHHHSSMSHVGKIRKQLGFRTLFNVLGPLSNPAGAKRQLVGVYDRSWLEKLARALGKLGAEKALVVHGKDGLDEITLTGKTFCVEWDGESTREYILEPEDFGLSQISIEDIRGGSPEDNAKALENLLNGEKGAYRDIVLANTAALLRLADKCDNLKDGVDMAANAIDSERALDVLNNYKNL